MKLTYGMISIIEVHGEEYLKLKTNPKNVRLLSLKNKKQYNISKMAKQNFMRFATKKEIDLANEILNPAASHYTAAQDEKFKVGQIVKLKSQHVTKYFPAGTLLVVTKVNTATVGIAILNPVGEAVTASAPPNFLEIP